MNDNNLPTDAGQCFEGDEDDPNYHEDADPPGPSRLSVFALIACWGCTATCYVLLTLNNKILKTVLGLIMFGRSGGDACWRAINEFRCIVAMLVLAQAAVVRSAKLPAIDTSGARDPVNAEEQGQRKLAAAVATHGQATGEGRGLAASCGLGSGNVLVVPSGVVPDTTGIRLQTAAGTPSFDSEGQVQGRLEVNVGGASWYTVADKPDWGINFGEFESTVACRQLGNELDYTLVSASKVGSSNTDDGSLPAYFVECSGPESTLDSCTDFQYFGGGGDVDVGVACTFLAPGNECDECVAGKFSDTTSIAACMDCAAGSYMSTVGAASCEQVRVEG
jgi:hypothetical protein